MDAMLLMSTKSAWSWSRITWDSSGEFGAGRVGSKGMAVKRWSVGVLEC
jgi:hypothetical protein